MNYLKQVVRLLFDGASGLALSLLVSHSVWAVECGEVFSGPIASSAPNSVLSIGYEAQIFGSNQGQLDVADIDNEGSFTYTCPDANRDCRVSGELANDGTNVAVKKKSRGQSVNVGYQESVTLGGGAYNTDNFGDIRGGTRSVITFSSQRDEYFIKNIALDYQSVLRLSPGSYWIDGNFDLGGNAKLEVLGNSGTVKIFVKEHFITGYQSQLNFNGNPLRLAIYTRDRIELAQETKAAFVAYARKNIRLEYQAEVSGALFSRHKIIDLAQGSKVYGVANAGEVDFSPMCEGTYTPPPVCPAGLNFSTYDSRPWNSERKPRSPENAKQYQKLVKQQAVEKYYLGSSILTRINGGGRDVNPHSSQQDYYLGIISGYLNAPESGTYQFAVDGDDAVELLIDEQVVTGYYGLHSKSEQPQNRVSLNLAKGWHKVEFRYHEHTGNEYYYLYWQKPSEHRLTIIPASQFQTCIGDPPVGEAALKLEVASIGLSCEAHTVTLTALLDGAVDQSFLGSVDLSSSSGNGEWAILNQANNGYGSLSPSMNGAAQYTFAADDQGQVQLSIFHALEGQTSLKAQDGSIFDSQNVDFKAYGFKTELSGSYGENPHIANTDARLRLTAVGKNQDGPGCAQIVNYTGEKSLSFWSDYLNPSQGSQGLSVKGTVVGAAEGEASDVKVQFTAGQSESIALVYPDAGKIAVNFWDKNDSIDDEGLQTLRASVNLDWLPERFVWSDVRSPSGKENPQGTASSGDGFVAAGAPFEAELVALKGNCDGPLTDCTTANFKPESSQAVKVSHQLNTPLDPDGSGPIEVFDGELTVADVTWENGRATYEGLAWNEVGSIALKAQLVSYLDYTFPLTAANGEVFTPQGSVDVGRFYPAYYGLDSSEIRAGCGSFTYLGQPQQQLSWKIGAYNTGGDLVKNYDSATDYRVQVVAQGGEPKDHWQLGGLSDEQVNQRWLIDPVPQGWSQGWFELSSPVSSGLTKREGVVGEEPIRDMEIGLVLIDQDGAQFNCNDDGSCSLGQAPEFRHGRLRLNNAYGSELQPIAATGEVQYFLNGRYQANTEDTCTDVSQNILQVAPEAAALPSNLETIAAVGEGASRVKVRSSAINQGILWFDFASPGQNNTGSVQYWLDFNPDNHPANLWLRDDWNGDGRFDDNDDQAGAGEVSFGIFRQSERVIERRMLY
ncbi:DUF6701 domain-containing protein [Agarivorans sp. QJM3NY_29]|uniref:DUF6701 domain-containing protein n=1 Tax=unclassified Agarivorans TaxID=2636026 RepID=UPI003D7DB27B